MLRSVIGFSTRNPGVVLGIACLALIYGLYTLSRVGLDIFPEFAPRQVIIQTEAAGYSPVQVELLVSRPIEQALSGLNTLRNITSESIQGLSVVIATFNERSDLYRNRLLVSERLATLTHTLPATVSIPTLVPLSSSSATILTLGIQSDQHSLLKLRDIVDTVIAPQLLATQGVADVNIFGGERRQIQIQIKPSAMVRFDISLQEILNAASRATSSSGLGFIENTNQRFSLSLSKSNQTIESLTHTIIKPGLISNLTLNDVATITEAPRPAIGAAAINGKTGIVIMVIGQYGANTLSVSQRLETVLQTIKPILQKQDITLHPHLFRPADYIQTSVDNLTGHLLIGVAFVILILFLFLFNLRIALIATLAIPLSLTAAALILVLSGVNLNIMILGGLAIALGEVVDDAIIDAENIFRRLNQSAHKAQQISTGTSSQSVIINASMEVRSSVVYATFIVALVFVPLLTLSGIAGRLYAPLGQAYILAILMSLLVALTVTPALCALLLKTSNNSESPPLIHWIKPKYKRLLEHFMARPKLVLIIIIMTILSSLSAATQLKHEFIPQLREGHFMLHTTSHPGTSLHESLRMGHHISTQLLSIDGIESVSQWAGRAERGADTYGSHYSEYEIRLRPLSGIQQQQIHDAIRSIVENYPGIRYELNTFLIERINETISGYTSPLVFNLYGSDLTQLDIKARQLALLLSAMEEIQDVRVQSTSGTPQLQIELNTDQLLHWGIQPAHVIEMIQTSYRGTIVGQIQRRSRPLKIVVTLPEQLRKQPDQLKQLVIRTPSGVWIQLADVATIRQTEARYNILHRNAKRLQTVTAHANPGDINTFNQDLSQQLTQQLNLPADMHLELTGAAVEQRESKRQLLIHSLLAGCGILLLIYLALGNLRYVVITLANLPFALVGGLIAALITNIPVSIGSMVGFVTLFGITVRNSIMLISHYRYLIEIEHLPGTISTMIQAAQERLPSILMTALVTALAMLPIAINSDNPGREIMGPMAVIIIGGLFSSTLLNLLLLPGILYHFDTDHENNGTHSRLT
ncbi:MAG TPA: efflux RND transporter permease subunit [Crenotrichaceae bacterium]|nr:efflux RND transporter permease subunit [Crenotrichaceae bacterium]